MELEVILVVQETFGEQHLRVDERGVVPSDEDAEREVALVDHGCSYSREVEVVRRHDLRGGRGTKQTWDVFFFFFFFFFFFGVVLNTLI